MSRILRVILVLVALLPVTARAQDFSGLARVEVGNSQISDAWGGGLRLELALTQGVPFRVYTLDEPRRLVLDFREIDWTGVTSDVLLNADRASGVRFGTFRPGWSRMVLDLAGPMAPEAVEMKVDPTSGKARLRVDMAPVDQASFAAGAGAPHDPRWDLPAPAQVAQRQARGDGPLVVVLDPGHGGIDPGAEREGKAEKDLMLAFAKELKEVLLRSGRFQVVLTRENDEFVSLERRIAIAHEAGAHVFLSLHADALSEGQAQGATLHLLRDSASDEATQQLAERHDRDDILSGVDLRGQDDVVAGILMDMARQETQPRAERLARGMITGFRTAKVPVNTRPLRFASFSVLKSADIPSILLEVGFMSNARDLKNLGNPNWRLEMAVAIRDSLRKWMTEDAALKELVRH
ncbi:N-acetylmuramoyl-L-alanine amidase [Thalassovita litoralis]|jgi:N-acetylmuramoyl-L-alanine amidase|uniref:N-acetylmuramoyl-L-alanine amidase n=1 Tax=Thalassovita litoralis TaxID=1010611 RepID=A0A521E4D0_9RHOB|nr:N-acetylmuramoyl-L-alanine amidase [Thalassovita litoralis]SMO78777.1 N-acetylmuramoyl-L-alanine amidase [Thalassovita litoralis]